MPLDNDNHEALPSRRPTAEERFWLDYAAKEPVESIARLEEVAKFLVGATATTSGLFLAAFKIAQGTQTVSGWRWFLPFLLWGLSILAQILVLFPRQYQIGTREPASWRQALLRARRIKYSWLTIGTLLFLCGLLAAVYTFTPTTIPSPGTSPTPSVSGQETPPAKEQ